MNERHILDLRAGVAWSPEDLRVLELTARGAWGNPLHPSSEGRRAATWLEAAEATVGQITGRPHVRFFPDRMTALRVALAQHPGLPVSVASTHRKQVLALATDVSPVDEQGTVSWNAPQLAILQSANEETGVADPLPASGLTILDASNSFGRVPTTQRSDYVVADSLVWGSPSGVAFLLADRPIPETEAPPLPLIAVAVQALERSWSSRDTRSLAEELALRQLQDRVQLEIPDVQFHSVHPAAPIRSFSVLHLDAETLTRTLNIAGFVVGSGSACVLDGSPSHVLAAMGRVTHGNIRIALPVDCELAVLDHFAETLSVTVSRLRREAGVENL